MLTMSHTHDVVIYDKTAPDTRKTLKGRTIGPWTVANTGKHTKWGVYDTATGMRLFHACPTLTEAKAILSKLDKAGLILEATTPHNDLVWGSGSSYTSESIRAIGAIVTPYVKEWTGRK